MLNFLFELPWNDPKLKKKNSKRTSIARIQKFGDCESIKEGASQGLSWMVCEPTQYYLIILCLNFILTIDLL
jgi:hypothetical protein